MSRSEHEMRMLDQNYGRIEDRRQERLINERASRQALDELGDGVPFTKIIERAEQIKAQLLARGNA